MKVMEIMIGQCYFVAEELNEPLVTVRVHEIRKMQQIGGYDILCEIPDLHMHKYSSFRIKRFYLTQFVQRISTPAYMGHFDTELFKNTEIPPGLDEL